MFPQKISAKVWELTAGHTHIDKRTLLIMLCRYRALLNKSLSLASIILLASWLYSANRIGASAASYSNQSLPQNAAVLTVGAVIERELVGTATHRYQFSLHAGHYLRLSVEQKELAVVASLFDSNGVKLMEADYVGKENVSVIAPLSDGKPSDYHVEVRARLRAKQSRPVGRYVIKIEEQRPAAARDEDRVNAERMVADAMQKSSHRDQTREAIEQYRASLRLWRTSPVQRDDRLEEARTLYLLALRQQDVGENQAALESYLQALEISQQEFDQRRECLTLSSLGTLYVALGDKRKAIDCYHSALKLNQVHRDKAIEAGIQINLGIAYKALGENTKAMEFYQLALTGSRAMGDQELEASVLTNLARLYDLIGDKTTAINHYQQLLPLWRSLADCNGEAVTLKNLGALHESTGRKEEALDHYRKALELSQLTGDLVREAHIRGDLARVERDLGNFKASRVEIEQALAFFELQRQQLLNPELRASFSVTNQQYHEFYIDLLIQQANLQTASQLSEQGGGQARQRYLAEAFLASESARTRALADLIAESRIDLRDGISPQLLQYERSLGQELTIRKAERVAMQRKKSPAAELDPVEQEIVRLSAAYEQTQSKIRQMSPRFAALLRPMPISLMDVQRQLLDADSVLLEFSLGEKRSYVWAISQNKFQVAALPSRAEIEEQAQKFYDLLTARSQTVKFETAQQKQLRIVQSERELQRVGVLISDALLQPVADMLEQKRLLIVGDGILNYIPFAALPEPGFDRQQPLLVNHEIVNLPSATVLAELRRDLSLRKTATKDLAIVADPVFSRLDERLNLSQSNSPLETATTAVNRPTAAALESVMRSPAERDAGGLTRLPYSRREAFKIAALAPEEKRLLALDFQANRSLVTEGLLSPYRYVHFATHGLLNSQSPELSGLVLSLVNDAGEPQLGVLRMGDIYKLNLSAELVVLSACRTGLGKEIRGEGVIGLSRGFMHAGVPRIISSLWSVDDAATAELMSRFYRELMSGKPSPANALRSAQLSLWKTKSWQSPYYWAAFTLQGEPK